MNFDESLGTSYSDADNDDLYFPPLPVTSSAVGVTPSVLQHGHSEHLTLAAQSPGAHSDIDSASCASVYAPILVVPSSDSFVSMIQTPDSTPDRPPMFSPSQVRCD